MFDDTSYFVTVGFSNTVQLRLLGNYSVMLELLESLWYCLTRHLFFSSSVLFPDVTKTCYSTSVCQALRNQAYENIGCSSLGGCETEAKSHINTQREDTHFMVRNQTTHRYKYTLKRANIEKQYIFVPSLQCGRRRCNRVYLLLLRSSPFFSVSSDYDMRVQSIMEVWHWAYLALFLAKSTDLCVSVRLFSL